MIKQMELLENGKLHSLSFLDDSVGAIRSTHAPFIALVNRRSDLNPKSTKLSVWKHVTDEGRAARTLGPYPTRSG